MNENVLNRVIEGTVMNQQAPMIHVRYEGQSWDFPLNELDIGNQSTDQQVRAAVAERLNAPPAKLRNFAIDRSPTGEMTLRPEAVFG